MNDLFPQLPEDLGAMTREDLQAAITERETALARCATGEAFADMETPPDRNERIAILKAGKDQLLALRAALDAHETEDAEFEAEQAAILNEVGVTLEDEATDPEPEPEPEPEPTDPDDETEDGVAELAAEAVENAEETDEPESQTAAAKQRRYSTRPPATPKRHDALTVESGAVLRATAGIDSVKAGTELDARRSPS